MAPEVVSGDAYSTPADVYSFAILLAELSVWDGNIKSVFEGKPAALAVRECARGWRPALEKLFVAGKPAAPSAVPTASVAPSAASPSRPPRASASPSMAGSGWGPASKLLSLLRKGVSSRTVVAAPPVAAAADSGVDAEAVVAVEEDAGVVVSAADAARAEATLKDLQWPTTVGLDILIAACWAHDPAERPSFGDVVQSLEAMQYASLGLSPPERRKTAESAAAVAAFGARSRQAGRGSMVLAQGLSDSVMGAAGVLSDAAAGTVDVLSDVRSTVAAAFKHSTSSVSSIVGPHILSGHSHAEDKAARAAPAHVQSG